MAYTASSEFAYTTRVVNGGNIVHISEHVRLAANMLRASAIKVCGKKMAYVRILVSLDPEESP